MTDLFDGKNHGKSWTYKKGVKKVQVGIKNYYSSSMIDISMARSLVKLPVKK